MNDTITFMKKINWAILCYRDNPDETMDILHLCGYENKPGQDTIDSLQEELATDPEFGLIGEEYEMMLINRETGYKYFEMLGVPDEFPEE